MDTTLVFRVITQNIGDGIQGRASGVAVGATSQNLLVHHCSTSSQKINSIPWLVLLIIVELKFFNFNIVGFCTTMTYWLKLSELNTQSNTTGEAHTKTFFFKGLYFSHELLLFFKRHSPKDNHAVIEQKYFWEDRCVSSLAVISWRRVGVFE
jgi:Ran GTPase-activating protein (RanGAP) involved in mRNA processing and transport